MGQIGFLLNHLNEQIVVMIETNKTQRTMIIGFEQTLNHNIITQSYFLAKDLNLQQQIHVPSSRTCYSKISVSNESLLSIEDVTLWVSPKLYKDLYSNFILQTTDDSTIITAVNSIVELLQL